jgi:hypothetical protein
MWTIGVCKMVLVALSLTLRLLPVTCALAIVVLARTFPESSLDAVARALATVMKSFRITRHEKDEMPSNKEP